MIDLALVKSHLRVDSTEEDALIQAYTGAAFSAFTAWSNRAPLAVGAELPDPAGNALIITKSIEMGALLLIGHWFANREAVLVGVMPTEMPMATRALWAPYRWVNI